MCVCVCEREREWCVCVFLCVFVCQCVCVRERDLKMAAVIQPGAERRHVAGGSKPSQAMTFDPNSSLWEVEVVRVTELGNVRMAEV